MGMRSVAALKINLGLFGFPVKTYTAVDKPTGGIAFRQLHAKCGGPVNRVDRCRACKEDLTAADIVKGYQDGEMMIRVSGEEIEALKPVRSEEIAVTGYLGLTELDPSYLDGPVYYLSPDRGKNGKGDCATFVTFRDALRGRFAIGSVVMYGREHIVAIRAYDRLLAMHFVRTHAEIRRVADVPDVESVPASSTADYVKMMAEVMDAKALTMGDVALDKDSYVEAVEALLESKRTGEPIKAPVEQRLAESVGDLTAKLKASLAAVGKAA